MTIGQRFLIGLLCAVLWSAQATEAVEDDTGHTLRLDQSARRIVSLAPHLTELLFTLGAGDRIVGTVNYSDYPEQARTLPRVGGYNALDLERILALEPDLIVGWASGNNPADLEKLRRLGLPLFLSEPRRLSDIPQTLQRLAVLTDTVTRADRVIRDFEQKLAGLRRFSDREPVSLFYQIWDRPLMTVNDQHIIGDVIRLCGGRNIFADAPALTPQVSEEAVLTRAPQAIVVGGLSPQHAQWLAHWRQWPQIPAVRNDHLFMINPDHLQRQSTRILQGAQTLCGMLEQVRTTRRPLKIPAQ